MRELTAVMSLLFAIATSLAVFAAARPAPSERPTSHPAASAVAR